MKLKAATLHENIFVEGIGEVNKVLTTRHSASLKAVEELTLEDGMVTVKLKDQVKKTVTVLIPVTNFRVLVPET